MMSRVICWMRSQVSTTAALLGRLLAELLQVVAGAEGAAGAGEHDRAGCRVGLRRDQCLVQVGQQFGADGVQPLGPVQRDDAHRAPAPRG